MGFWVFILVMDLILPILMIVVGYMFGKNPPHDTNKLLCYKSKRARINKQTCEYANRLLGNIWFVLGAISLPISLIPLLMIRDADMQTTGITGGIVIAVQGILMLIVILVVEILLRQKYDENGNVVR